MRSCRPCGSDRRRAPLPDRSRRSAPRTRPTGHADGAVGATAVVRPATIDEVAAVLRACADAGIGVVPQGGNTGLVGGSVPRGGEVVLSLLRLQRVGEVDRDAGEVTVGAGATLAPVQAAARAAGWEVGVDMASRDSATIGGMVATNAGGVNVVRHGPMRAQLIGFEAVLADGTRHATPGRACRRTTPATTWAGCWPAARGRWPSSPRSGCASCRRARHRAVCVIGFAMPRRRSGPPASCAGGWHRSWRWSSSPTRAWTSSCATPRSRRRSPTPYAGLPAGRGRLGRGRSGRRPLRRARGARRRRRRGRGGDRRRRDGIGCGSCASATPRPSTPRACRTSSTSRCR